MGNQLAKRIYLNFSVDTFVCLRFTDKLISSEDDHDFGPDLRRRIQYLVVNHDADFEFLYSRYESLKIVDVICNEVKKMGSLFRDDPVGKVGFQRLTDREMDMCVDKVEKWNTYIVRKKIVVPAWKAFAVRYVRLKCVSL